MNGLKPGFLPMEPLERIAKARAAGSGMSWSNETFAMLVGMSSRAISRWRAAGSQIQWGTCDSCAISLGLHPSDVWGSDWHAQDQGIIDGTDKAGLRALDKAMDIIGAKMAEDRLNSEHPMYGPPLVVR